VTSEEERGTGRRKKKVMNRGEGCTGRGRRSERSAVIKEKEDKSTVRYMCCKSKR